MLKLNQVQKTVCALAVLAATSLPVLAAPSIDVKVVGTISPTACEPTLTGGGTIDYGTIQKDTLAADVFTVLPEKQLEFAITCDAPAKVALKANNGRPGSVAGATELAGIANNPIKLFDKGTIGTVGLGLSEGAKIGGYAMRIAGSTVLIDGAKATPLQSDDEGISWQVVTDDLGSLYRKSSSPRWNSWGVDGATAPSALTTLTGKLEVQAYINKTSELDLTKPIALDGLTTLELVYL